MPGVDITEATTQSLSELPEYLIVAAFPASHLDQVARILEQGGAQLAPMPATGKRLPVREPGPPSVLAPTREAEPITTGQWLDGNSAIHCLCIAEGPVAYIARALKEGGRLEEAVTDWQRETRSALELLRRNPFQCLTILHEQLQAHPSRFARVLHEKYGIELNLDLEPEKPEPEDALFSILAAQHVNQETELSDVALELEASAWPLSENPPSTFLDSSAAVEAYRGGSRQLEEFRQQFREFESLRDEREQVLAQLHSVQLELEEQHRELGQERESHALTREELKKAREEDVKELRIRAQTLEKERDQALEEKSETGESLKQIRIQLKTERQRYAETKQRLEYVEDRLKATEKGQTDHEGVAQRLDELQSENDALLSQLHTVQLEVEGYFNRYDAEKQTNEALARERDTLKTEHASIVRQLEVGNAQIVSLREIIQQQEAEIGDQAKTIRGLEQRIRAIRVSTSWRITKPLRAMIRVLKWPFQRRWP